MGVSSNVVGCCHVSAGVQPDVPRHKIRLLTSLCFFAIQRVYVRGDLPSHSAVWFGLFYWRPCCVQEANSLRLLACLRVRWSHVSSG